MDLTREAPSLLDAVGRARGSRAVHLTYDPSVWNSDPKRVYLDGHRAKIGWFHMADPHQVTVSMLNGTRVILMVVPPEMDAGQARWVLDRSIEPGNDLRPSQLLTEALVEAEDGIERWFGEGGLATRADTDIDSLTVAPTAPR
jgi:hypothetical protein